MKKLIIALLPLSIFGQNTYWQQHVDYTMEIDMNVKTHQFTGKQVLEYTNNSPDTLYQVFYHLYFNAFQPNSMMDIRSQNIVDPDKRIGKRIAKLKEAEIGYHKIDKLNQDGAELKFEYTQTLLQVELAKPIPPKGKSTFEMDFNSQVPIQIRRSGRDNAEGIDYTMTQWYPKMAEYDEDGWHANPYVAREFYAPFGNFDVKITINSKHKLGATGMLQNPEAFWKRDKNMSPGVYSHKFVKSKEKKRTWHFIAENVHDFAWAADEDYIHLSNETENGTTLHYYYLPDVAESWVQLPAYTVAFFREMNIRFGVYPYPQFSVIQGGDGGMEYPMCTMLKGTGEFEGLKGVTTHEAAHNWFYGVLASNEFQYPWMDEGFTTYAEEEVLNALGEEVKRNAHARAFGIHKFLFSKGEQSPMSTPSDYYTKNRTYSINAYYRGSLFLSQLRYIVGDDVFAKLMLNYFDQWKFKHPDPWDFIRVAEKTSGIQLDWYLNFWMNTTKTVDYGFRKIKANENGTAITFERLGEMPMPIRFTVYTKSGKELEYYIPLVSMMGAPKNANVQEPWPWTHKDYTLQIDVEYQDIDKMYIDEHEFSTDMNRANNVSPMEMGEH